MEFLRGIYREAQRRPAPIGMPDVPAPLPGDEAVLGVSEPEGLDSVSGGEAPGAVALAAPDLPAASVPPGEEAGSASDARSSPPDPRANGTSVERTGTAYRSADSSVQWEVARCDERLPSAVSRGSEYSAVDRESQRVPREDVSARRRDVATSGPARDETAADGVMRAGRLSALSRGAREDGAPGPASGRTPGALPVDPPVPPLSRGEPALPRLDVGEARMAEVQHIDPAADEPPPADMAPSAGPAAQASDPAAGATAAGHRQAAMPGDSPSASPSGEAGERRTDRAAGEPDDAATAAHAPVAAAPVDTPFLREPSAFSPEEAATPAPAREPTRGVSIGQVDVIVASPEPIRPRPGAAPTRRDGASRHYLRRLR